MAGPFLRRDKQPGRDPAPIERAIPDELPVGEFARRQFAAETIDQDPPTLARGGHETVRCCECGIEEDQAATARLPERTARGPFGARDAARTPSCGGNGLELDVSVPVLQERDRFPIGGPQGPGFVPFALDEPSYTARPDVEDSDILVIMDVRHEGELTAIRRPRLGSPEVATDRALRIRDLVHVRELLRLASRRLDDEDIVSVAIPV